VTRLSDEYCTIIHGDCKTSNVFMSSDEIVPIDFQWTGWGNHMADVTYFLLQSVQIELL
jgi:thiamine kinase-like enzyme